MEGHGCGVVEMEEKNNRARKDEVKVGKVRAMGREHLKVMCGAEGERRCNVYEAMERVGL